MLLKRPVLGFFFCIVYLTCYVVNKYVLSVLKFTYPTLFQGWQTLVGGLLLHVTWKSGFVEVGNFTRSAVLSWLPGSVLFVGIIYAGSRALSRLPIPIFFTFHNASEVFASLTRWFICKESASPTKFLSLLLLVIAATCLPYYDAQFDPDGYFWVIIHLLCTGGYKAFQKLKKSSVLSEIEQQYINYAFSVLLLAFAAHPTGDFSGALEFPFLYFYRFHGGCCASGILGFILVLITVKLKSNSSSTHCGAWTCFAKILSAALSPLIFDFVMNAPTLFCLLLGVVGDALLIYTERNNGEGRS